jgi:hypothetical protein
MISGHATPSGTLRAAERHPAIAFNDLGSTGLRISPAGFGCYRVSSGVSAHRDAMVQALTNGINLIDTSANYADGGSEQLVGEVLADLIGTQRVTREAVVVVSKGGYLQGQNYRLSQERKQAGNPFADLVEYADGLEHCVHPDFLDDQIGRSLRRLGLETIDGYLLHNPEYYLGWAHKNGIEPEAARSEYNRRIDQAFRHLESEVRRGRIRFYGISSNTFPAADDHPEFTSLHRVREIAAAIGSDHHFRLIQLPFNLLEPGAAVQPNQPDGGTVLEVARKHRIGVLVNRPLNAIAGSRMLRLASIDGPSRMDDEAIIDCIQDLAQSEVRLWRKLLPRLDAIPEGIDGRIKQQVSIADILKHHWRSFDSYEHLRQVKEGNFLPRIQGVGEYLSGYSPDHPELADWISSHQMALDRALRAVASSYADDAIALERRVFNILDNADSCWGRTGTLSQAAIRALISTDGVSTVLVGMRRQAYVADVLDALGTACQQTDRSQSWRRLSDDVQNGF